jgi:recombinational DNA repair protein (RecF pathway)
MRIGLLWMGWMLFLFSNASTFVSSQVCAKCHPAIYSEYLQSMHRKSSVYNDPVHRAVWEKHPLKRKGRYTCARCHTPSDEALIEALENNVTALPRENLITREEPIGCATCHRIEYIKKGLKHHTNVYSSEPKHYFAAKAGEQSDEKVRFHETYRLFGLVTDTKGSPFHTIDYTNKGFSDGSVCLGCHEYKRNKHGFAVCDMGHKKKEGKDKSNCISCHMPQTEGSVSTLSFTKSHAFHGFAGVHTRPDLLAKYIELSAEPQDKQLRVTIKNKADHKLFTHPLRLGELRVEIERNGKHIELEPIQFFRKIGNKGKPTPPWSAKEVIAQRYIDAHTAQDYLFNVHVQKGDIVTVRLGYRIVNPVAAKKLGLDNEELTKFRVLKSRRFRF